MKLIGENSQLIFSYENWWQLKTRSPCKQNAHPQPPFFHTWELLTCTTIYCLLWWWIVWCTNNQWEESKSCTDLCHVKETWSPPLLSSTRQENESIGHTNEYFIRDIKSSYFDGNVSSADRYWCCRRWHGVSHSSTREEGLHPWTQKRCSSLLRCKIPTWPDTLPHPSGQKLSVSVCLHK